MALTGDRWLHAMLRGAPCLGKRTSFREIRGGLFGHVTRL
jgi:hypothetical protein